MRKIGLIIIIGFILRLIVSCCDCPDTKEYRYTFNSIEVFHVNNSGQTPVIVDNGIIPKEAYGLRLECLVAKLAFNESIKFFEISSAYAFDCDCPPEIAYFAKDTISNIRITTLNNFDDSHPAGSDISDFFKVFKNDSFITIQEFIGFPERAYYENPDNEIINFYLLKSPSIIGEFRFKIEILLSDGTNLTSVTSAITLE